MASGRSPGEHLRVGGVDGTPVSVRLAGSGIEAADGSAVDLLDAECIEAAIAVESRPPVQPTTADGAAAQPTHLRTVISITGPAGGGARYWR